MSEIRSESKFLIKIFFEIICLPYVLVQIIKKKEKPETFFRPIKELKEYFFEPKFTSTIILITIFSSIILAILPEEIFVSLLLFPSDVLNPFRWFSFLTAGFLHANLMHLIGNMFAVFIFGRVVERKLGAKYTAMIYFFALIFSSVSTSILNYFVFSNDIPALGASGAVMGLISAAILLDPFYITYELILPLPVMLVGWITIYADVIGILSPVDDGIGHIAHLGGFLSISLALFFLDNKHRKEIKKGILINTISLMLFIGLYLAYYYF